MLWLDELLSRSTDLEILLSGAVLTAGLALVLTVLTRSVLFARLREALEAQSKLAELVHNSLLAFAVFVLALVLSDVRSNLGKADDAAHREASIVTRLDEELSNFDGEAADRARAALAAYVKSAVSEDWPALGQAEPMLSPSTSQAKRSLNVALKQVMAERPESSTVLRGLMDRLEDLRQGRLESATKSVPTVFWWVLAVFIGGAMVMNGRHQLEPFSAMLIALHMGAIGMVVALILITDSPFRGESRVSPTPLIKAIDASRR